jgi:hypothetical protein
MRKTTYFDPFPRDGWPEPKELEPYFLASKGREWSYAGGNDNWGLGAEGLHGTENLQAYRDRVDVRLRMWGNPEHGVLLIYQKWGGGHNDAFSSKGDLRRLRDLVRTLHDDSLPVGLFIPFAQAWNAVKEFIETDGELPKSIDWIANKDLPANTFPDP